MGRFGWERCPVSLVDGTLGQSRESENLAGPWLATFHLVGHEAGLDDSDFVEAKPDPQACAVPVGADAVPVSVFDRPDAGWDQCEASSPAFKAFYGRRHLKNGGVSV